MLEKNIEENEEPKSYFDLDNPIEDEYYKGIKNLIKCKNCGKIIKDPMMCKECQGAFCKKCTEETNGEHKCADPSFVENISANFLLKNLKYLCQNCKDEVKQEKIESHLKEGCIQNEKPSTLIEEIFRKKSLEPVTQEELKKLPGQSKNVNHVTCKIFLLNINWYLILLI